MLPRTPPALAALPARVSRTELTPGSACRAGTLCRPVARGSARASPSPSPSPPAHIATALARRHPRRRLVRASPPPSPSPSPWTAGGAGAASPRGRALSLAPRHPPPRRSNRHRPSRGAGRRTPSPLSQQPPPLPPSPPLPPPPPRSRVRCVALPLCWHCWRPRVAAWQEPGDATRRHQYERNEPPADPL